MIKSKIGRFFKIAYTIIRFNLKVLLCRHKSYTFVRTISGDEINLRDGMRSEWKCNECGNLIYKKFLNSSGERHE